MNAHDSEQPAAADVTGRVLVVGYGNPIRGDDALGPLVADRLMDGLPPDRVEVCSRHLLTADLVGPMCHASLVVFIDASKDGPAGQVVCRRLTPATAPASSMAHFLDPGELLGWTRQLYDHEPEAYLLSVRGVKFDFALYELSPPVQAAIEPLLAKVHTLIDGRLRRAEASIVPSPPARAAE